MKSEEIRELSNLQLINALENACFKLCYAQTKASALEFSKIEKECGRRFGFDPGDLKN